MMLLYLSVVHLIISLFTQVEANLLSNSTITEENDANRTIILITATQDRAQRAADFNMLVHTLKHLPYLHKVFWIVVEGDSQKNSYIQSLVSRSKIPYVYLLQSDQELCNGWSRYNKALEYIRRNREKFSEDSVVYFASDENGYDLKLFEKYISNVERMGVWASGSGYVSAESPMVFHGQIIGWNAAWRPKRRFALNFHSFALNIRAITETYAIFDMRCAGLAPEDCFLRQIGIQPNEIQPFGHDSDPKQILVYHRRVDNKGFFNELPSEGFFFDYSAIETNKCMLVRRKYADITGTHAQAIAEAKYVATPTM